MGRWSCKWQRNVQLALRSVNTSKHKTLLSYETWLNCRCNLSVTKCWIKSLTASWFHLLCQVSPCLINGVHVCSLSANASAFKNFQKVWIYLGSVVAPLMITIAILQSNSCKWEWLSISWQASIYSLHCILSDICKLKHMSDLLWFRYSTQWLWYKYWQFERRINPAEHAVIPIWCSQWAQSTSLSSSIHCYKEA